MIYVSVLILSLGDLANVKNLGSQDSKINPSLCSNTIFLPAPFKSSILEI